MGRVIEANLQAQNQETEAALSRAKMKIEELVSMLTALTQSKQMAMDEIITLTNEKKQVGRDEKRSNKIELSVLIPFYNIIDPSGVERLKGNLEPARGQSREFAGLHFVPGTTPRESGNGKGGVGEKHGTH